MEILHFPQMPPKNWWFKDVKQNSAPLTSPISNITEASNLVSSIRKQPSGSAAVPSVPAGPLEECVTFRPRSEAPLLTGSVTGELFQSSVSSTPQLTDPRGLQLDLLTY